MEQWKELSRLCQEEDIIIIIGCGKAKVNRPEKRACLLYIGSYFSSCFRLARLLVGESNVRILSAKYGLLLCDDIIKPYDMKLSLLTKKETKKWELKVWKQIERLNKPYFFLCSHLYSNPFPGDNIMPKARMGYQMQWMREQIFKKEKQNVRLED